MDTVDERLIELARTAGGRTALVGWRGGREEALTWGELERRTADRARDLAASGPVGSSDRVVVVPAGNDVTSAVAVLSCLRAGVPVLPLDPRMGPGERRAVGHQLLAWGFTPHGTTSGSFPVTGTALADRPPAVAYLLCTSGSTGQPKVVPRSGAVSHHPDQIPNPVLRRTGWRADQRQVLVVPIHHAAGFMSFIEGVLGGNTVVLQADFVATELWELIVRHRIDWLLLTPTHMRVALTATSHDLRLPPRLSLLHTGAFCDPDLKRKWIDLLGAEQVFEMYGSTDAIGATLIRGDEWLTRPGSVGRAVSAQIRILDERFGVLPPHQVGDVFLRIPRPAGAGGRSWVTTGQRCTPTGFVSVGDRGWLDESGYLFLTGRSDDLIIVGGENVYPAQIETVIRQVPGVRDVAVVGAHDPIMGQRVVAYVVPEPVGAPDREQVLRHAAKWLSLSKLPKEVRFVDELPRTATGKLQRWRLAGAQA